MSEDEENEPIDDALAGLGGVQLDGPRHELRKHGLKARLFGEGHAPPSRVGRFVVLDELGHGGMGTVLRAYDATLHREIAIKLLHQDLQGEYDARLLREAQALARLDHPNVVRVYEAGSDDGRMFLAMELLEGTPLDRWQQQPRSWRECLDVYLQAGRGLAAAHGVGLVHRDFKPANCMLDEDQRVHVLDFGLARQASAHEVNTELDASHDSGLGDSATTEPGRGLAGSVDPTRHVLEQRLTATDEVMGTLVYLAPERLSRRPADALGDQFSFCVALYEALTGQLPFTDRPMPILLEMVERRPSAPLPPPPGRPIPRWLQRTLWRGLSACPEDRWPSMDQLLDSLERHQRRRALIRRATQMTVGSLAVVMAIVAALPPQPPSKAPCQGPAHRLDKVWGDDQQQAVKNAILATRRPYADQTWDTVHRVLGHYADDWTTASTEVCEATRVRHEQPLELLELQNRCLRHRRAALRYDIDLLATADGRLVDQAVDLVIGLPSIEGCREIEAPTRSPQLDRKAEAVRADLERIRSLDRIGRHEQGLAELEPLLGRTRDLGDGPVRAEVLEMQGRLHANAGHHEMAEEPLRRAHTMALTYEADEVAVRAMTGLIHLVGVKRDQTGVALELGSTAEALAVRPWVDEALLAQVLTAKGQVLTMRGEYAGARQRYADAIEILERTQGVEDIALVEALNGQAAVADAEGDRELATASLRRALEIRTKWQGASHPATANLMTELGVVLAHHGAHPEAMAQYRRALEILTSTDDPDHGRLAHTHTNLGSLLSRRGKYLEAEDQLRRAIEHWELAGEADQPRMAKARFNLGVVLQAQGRPLEALEQYERAHGALERDENTPQVATLKATILRNLGSIFAEQGHGEEAHARHRQALEVLDGSTADRDPIAASVRNRLGGLLLERGEAMNAERLHREALTIYEAHDPDRVNVGHTLRRLARALIAQGQWAAARPVLQRALEVYRGVEPPPKPERIADAERLLADVYRHEGAYEDAVQLERQAQDRLTKR